LATTSNGSAVDGEATSAAAKAASTSSRLLPAAQAGIFAVEAEGFVRFLARRWYHTTAKCMSRPWRYAFLLGDLGELVFRDGGTEWAASNGNPCANLWNFQLEIEAFALSSLVVALPPRLMVAGLATAVAMATSALPAGRGLWLAYHGRGVALLLLALNMLGLPHAGLPPARWRTPFGVGLALFLVAGTTHGVAHGSWLEGTAPGVSRAVRGQPAAAIFAYQAALAFGAALVCEACRAAAACERGLLRGSRALSIASRLSFGINAAHPFVQFWVEAHASLGVRVFSVFSWLAQLFGIAALSALVAACAFVLVQRPWGIVFGGHQ